MEAAQSSGEKVNVAKNTVVGGIACCVPGCHNNSIRMKSLGLCWYVIPKDTKLRRKWLVNISRKNFQPTNSHRVCSAHFKGGKKTYMNNVPTIMPHHKSRPENIRTTKNSLKTNNVTGIESTVGCNPVCVETPNLEDEEKVKMKNEIEFLKRKMNEMRDDAEREIQELKLNNECLKDELSKMKFSFDKFKHNNAQFKFYTGFDNYDIFRTILIYLKPAADCLIYWGSSCVETGEKQRNRSRKLSVEEEFFMTLVRLRCAFPLEDLSIRYAMSTSHLSRIIITWIDFLYTQFRMLPIWASKETVKKTMPNCFKDAYPTTRVILDCTELFIEMPSSCRSQAATFSSYKHHNTAKGLVGIAPNGAITFVSDLYVGRISDRRITQKSGICSLLEYGDSVMADRGFNIQQDLPESVILNIPPFLRGKPQLNLEEEEETRSIASVRVHVERAIERVKNYKILQSVFPISMSAELNKIWIICCYLVNFLPPLVTN